MAIMLPSLREERAGTYSPFLPIDPKTGIVLQVPVLAHDAKAGTITYEDPESKAPVTTPVTGGKCKLQWKPDWAMRWVALGVDYEMAGKDLIDSVKLSGEICRALGGTPPEGFNYELFLDENGQKISKSKGNGLTIDEWLRYASPESLSCFMYREPKAAKRLHFDVIPRNVDDYQQFLEAYPRQDWKLRLGNPVWHIHAGHPPKADMPITFQMLLTLVSSSNAENAETLWGFIRRYRPGVTPQTHPKLDAMVGYAINYYRDFVAPSKTFREPNQEERQALLDLRDALSNLSANRTPEQIQEVIYDIGRRPPFFDENKKGKDGKAGVSVEWFNLLYQVLLGQDKGPRFGSFVALYGMHDTIEMIDGALTRASTRPPKIIFACDESGAKGYANEDEGYPGEVGVIAGIFVAETHLPTVTPVFQEIYDRFKPAVGKLHIADLPANQQEFLRKDIYAAIRQLKLPCFWHAIHVAGFHDWHKSNQRLILDSKRIADEARGFEKPRVKGGSPRDKSQSMHVELFVGLYTSLVGFLEERLKSEVDIEIRSDQIDSPIIKEFESVAKRLLVDSVSPTSVTGFDTLTHKLVHGEIRVEVKFPPSLHIQTKVRSLAIKPIAEGDGLVLAADILANSLNHLFKNRDLYDRYKPLNTPIAVARHPLAQNLDSFENWGSGDFVSDRLYRHPKATS
jgi:lysyl-tRNA synthetase class I